MLVTSPYPRHSIGQDLPSQGRYGCRLGWPQHIYLRITRLGLPAGIIGQNLEAGVIPKADSELIAKGLIAIKLPRELVSG